MAVVEAGKHRERDGIWRGIRMATETETRERVEVGV